MLCRARRIQNMGYTPTNDLWLSLRGGDVYFSASGSTDQFDQARLGSRGFGILDVGCASLSPMFWMSNQIHM